jgi:membrane complex biogenesis BtpA family protein
MLTRSAFAQRFGPRALFGMVHLAPLPGAPLFWSWDEVIGRAAVEARIIAEHGCDGFVIENYGDRPFTRGRVEAETVAAMTRVINQIKQVVQVTFGVYVLRNDPLSALGIAAATRAAFIRVNIHTGAMLTDQGIIEGDAYTTLRKRAALAPNVLIFADFLVKHAVSLAPVDPIQAAKDLRERGLADAVIITGAETGAAADPTSLRLLREAIPDAPLIVGSGLTRENAHRFDEADAAIVGTSLKGEDGRVEASRVKALARAFKSGV